MHRNRKTKKTAYTVVHSIEQAHNEHCISDGSRDTAGFVSRVVSTPTEHELLRVVAERRRCGTHGRFPIFNSVVRTHTD